MSSGTAKRRWLGRGAWAMLDQVFFAGANFAVHLVLARLLPESDYGAFAAGFAVFLIVGAAHTAFLTEPMVVFGSGRYQGRFARYLRVLMGSHLRLTGIAALGLAVTAAVFWALGQYTFATALLAFALAQPVMLLPWLLRDACYVRADPKTAAMSGMLYAAVIGVGLAVLWGTGAATIPAAIGVMGCAALTAGSFLTVRLAIPRRTGHTAIQRRAVQSRHVRYGLWAGPTNLIRFVPEQFPFLVLPLMLSYADGGAYKALNNLTMPFIMATYSVSALAQPVLVRRLREPGFYRLLVMVGGLLTAMPLLAWPLLGLTGGALTGLLYGDKYVEDAGLLWLLAGVPVAVAAHSTLHAAFKAAERPDRVLPCAVMGALVLIAVGLPLTAWLGLPGMALAVLIAHATQALAAGVILAVVGLDRAPVARPQAVGPNGAQPTA
ncbi:MAG: hypothetical protein AAF750_00415 [Planctomycetota bacterium]